MTTEDPDGVRWDDTPTSAIPLSFAGPVGPFVSIEVNYIVVDAAMPVRFVVTPESHCFAVQGLQFAADLVWPRGAGFPGGAFPPFPEDRGHTATLPYRNVPRRFLPIGTQLIVRATNLDDRPRLFAAVLMCIPVDERLVFRRRSGS